MEEEARCPRWKKPRPLWQWHASGSEESLRKAMVGRYFTPKKCQDPTQTRKVTLQKWRHKKRKNSVHAYLWKNQKRSVLRSEKYGDLTTTEHKKSCVKDVNLGTITDTLSRYKFSPLSGIRVKPKLHKRRRRMYESLQQPSQKPKVIHTYNSL